MVHRQPTNLLRLGRPGLAILVAALAVSCSAGEGSSSALQPGSASAAPASRTTNGKETSGAGGAASKPLSSVAPTPTGSTATSEQRPEASLDPLAFAPAADAGVSGNPPSPSASSNPAGTPPSEDDDDDDEEEEEDDDD
jgi:hypothetical protein